MAGDNALFIVPTTTPETPEVWLTFWYQMYGRTLGEINVYVMKDGVLGKPLWTKIGKQSNQLLNVHINIVTTGPCQVQYIFRFILFNATFNNISLYRDCQFYWWRKTEYPEKNNRPVASHCQTLSHNVSTTPCHERGTHNSYIFKIQSIYNIHFRAFNLWHNLQLVEDGQYLVEGKTNKLMMND